MNEEIKTLDKDISIKVSKAIAANTKAYKMNEETPFPFHYNNQLILNPFYNEEQKIPVEPKSYYGSNFEEWFKNIN